MKQKAKKPRWRRILAALGSALGVVLLSVMFYLSVVVSMPQKDLSHAIQQDQPLLAPSPAINLTAGQSINDVAAAFPVPVLCCAAGGELTLSSGTSYDTAFEDGVARILALNYTTSAGEAIQVISIYPVRALALIADERWQLVGEGPSLAGNNAVLMQRDGQLRLHTQSETGLYVVTTRMQDHDLLREILRSMQLMGGADAAS